MRDIQIELPFIGGEIPPASPIPDCIDNALEQLAMQSLNANNIIAQQLYADPTLMRMAGAMRRAFESNTYQKYDVTAIDIPGAFLP